MKLRAIRMTDPNTYRRIAAENDWEDGGEFVQMEGDYGIARVFRYPDETVVVVLEHRTHVIQWKMQIPDGAPEALLGMTMSYAADYVTSSNVE